MSARRALVIGVGSVRPTHPNEREPALDEPVRPRLEFVYAVVPRLERALVRLGYQVNTLVDPTRNALLEAVDQALDSTGINLLHVVAHGEPRSADPSALDVVPACGRTGVGTNVAEWLSVAAVRRTRVLFFVDLCGAGRTARQPWLALKGGRDTSVWPVTAAGPAEAAYDGRFSSAVAQVLEALAEDGLGTDPTCMHVSLPLVARRIGALVHQAAGLPQRVHAPLLDVSDDPPDLPFFPNPRYRNDSDHRTRQALPTSVRSFVDDLDDVLDQFRVGAVHGLIGRRRQLGALAAWLGVPASLGGQVCVVTGAPGAGKSALLSTLVCAAHPVLAASHPAVRQGLEPDARPRRMESLVALHARQRRLEDLVASLVSQLQLPTALAGGTIEAVADAVARLPRQAAIVVDALDEAVDGASVMAVLLLPLASRQRPDGSPACRILVGMRALSELAPIRELASLTGGVIDLDLVDPGELRDDLASFVRTRLGDLEGYAGSGRQQVRAELAASVAATLTSTAVPARQIGAFLVASLFLRYLASLPPAEDPGAARRLGEAVPGTLPEVLELDLASRPDAALLRKVLSALAHAKGDGMPAELIAAVATDAAAGLSRVEVPAVLAAGWSYLRSTVDVDGTTLYRLFHQGLSQYLRTSTISGGWPSTPLSPRRLFDRVLAAVPMGPDGYRGWRAAPPYLLRHAIEHAEDANRSEDLLADEQFLVMADPSAVLTHLDSAMSDSARLAAAVYRCSVGRHRDHGPQLRSRLLAVDALRYGDALLARRFAPAAGEPLWLPQWASGSEVSPALRNTFAVDTDHPTVDITEVNGRPLAVTGGDVMRVWDVITGQLLHTMSSGPALYFGGVAFACLGGRDVAATGDMDGVVRLWDLSTGEPAGDPIQAHDGYVRRLLATVLDGVPVLISAGNDGTVRSWQLATGQPAGEPLRHDGQVRAITVADVRGRRLLMTGGEDRVIRRFDLATGELVGAPLSGHEMQIHCLAPARLTGRPVLLSGGDDATLRVWDLETGAAIGAPIRHQGIVTAVATTMLDGRPVAVTVAADNPASFWEGSTVRMFDLATATPARSPQVVAMSWLRDLKITELGGRAVAVVVGGGHRGGPLVLDLDQAASVGAPRRSHTAYVTAVQLIRVGDQCMAVSAGRDGTLRCWDTDTGTVRGEPLRAPYPVDAIATADVDSRPIALVAGRPWLGPKDAWDVRAWDLTDGRPIGPPLSQDVAADAVPAPTINSLNGTLAIGDDHGRPTAYTVSTGGRVFAWDLTAGAFLGPIPLDRGEDLLSTRTVSLAMVAGTPVALHARLEKDAHSELRHVVRVHDLLGRGFLGVPIRIGNEYLKGLTAAALDAEPVVITCGDTIRVWDMATGSQIGRALTLPRTLRPMPSDAELTTPVEVAALATARAGGRRLLLVAYSRDTSITVWDLDAGAVADSIPTHASPRAMCLADEGTLLVAAGYEIVAYELAGERG